VVRTVDRPADLFFFQSWQKYFHAACPVFIYVEMDIQVIEIAVNPDHVHIFFKYPPKYSLSYIAEKIKGISSRILRKEFPHLQ